MNRHIKATPWAARSAALLVALALAGCATGPRREAAWTDPGLGAQSHFLRGAKVLVACATDDAALRQICQQQLTADLSTQGAVPLTLPAGTLTLNDRAFEDQLNAGAASLGAKAVMVVSLAAATTRAAGSGLSIGIGGFSFGGGGSGAGIGISAPIGGSAFQTGLSANAQITDAQSRRPIWTVTMVAVPSADLGAQVASLSSSLVHEAKTAGLFD